MSLFTLKDVWTLDCSENCNGFNSSAISVGNVDNDPDGDIKVVIGSFSGLLRIVGTISVTTDHGGDDNVIKNHSRAILLAELYLSAPILQVESGRFVSGSDKLHLAILQPHKLGIYLVSKLPGQVEHGSQYKVTLLYEHQLKRHSFNMCFGSFGQGNEDSHPASSDKIKARESRHFICVQSLDGTLSFFEQEVFTFSRYLPGFLLPGPLVYVPAWDSFLTVISWNLQCFKYSSLAMSTDKTYKQTQETSVGKKLTPEWSFSIGEESVGNIQVLVSNEDASMVRVVVGTFRHLYCFCTGGELIWSKRLDFQISYFHSYTLANNECISMVASGNEPYACYVYNGTTLKWTAKLPFNPVYIGRIDLNEIHGGIIMYSAEGHIVVGYLGTEPSLFVAPPVQSRDLDYEAAEIELGRLRKTISEAGEQNVVASKDSTVEIKVEFEGQKAKWIDATGMEVIALIGTIKLVCRLRVNDLRVTISTPKPIVCYPESVYIGDIVGRHSFPVEFYVENEAIPPDLQCDVYVFYIGDNGSPHFVQKSGIKIPLFIVAKADPHVEKEADCKLTFSVNKPMLSLTTLYNDFEWDAEASPTSITFRLYDGEKVTLLASTKVNASTSSRYRVQSDTIAAIHLVFRDFISRLQRKFGREKSDLSIELAGFENELPFLAEYYGEIDAHMLRRRRDIQIKEDLADRAAQIRGIQKRLLIRFRDKNPTPLTQLEILLEGSLDQINDSMNFMQENEMEKVKSECRVSGATRLMLQLVLIQGNKNLEEVSHLTNALCPYIWDYVDEFGWEESVYSGLSYLKSQLVTSQNFSQLDPAKLRKAIKSTLEKILKASQTPLPPAAESKVQTPSQPEKLVGNELIERMVSARARTARRRDPVLESIPEPAEGEVDQRTPSPQTKSPFEDSEAVSKAPDSNRDVLVQEEENNQGSELKQFPHNDSTVKAEINGPVEQINNESNGDENFW